MTEEANKTREELAAGLTVKERLFCENYVQHFNGSRAAREAGYSENTCAEIASQNLRKLHIRQYIDVISDDLVLDAEIGVKRILREFGRLAFFNPADLYDEDGNLIPAHKLPSHVAAAIAGIEVETLQSNGEDSALVKTKYKLASKQQALDSLGKYHKMFIERLHLTGKFSLEDLVAGANEQSDDSAE